MWKSLLLFSLVIGVVLASSASSPRQIWSTNFSAGNSTFGDPSFTNIFIQNKIVVFTTPNPTVVCMNSSTGSVIWSTPINTEMPLYNGWVTTDGVSAVYAGTTYGVVAMNVTNGQILWTWQYSTTQQEVPAHPTYSHGRVFLTFENGVTSTPLVVLNATTGHEVYRTAQDVAVTLIWNVQSAGAVGYCGSTSAWIPQNLSYCVLRLYNGTILWDTPKIPFTDPGLWDNPNMVVDTTGDRVYVYSKPEAQLRVVTAHEASTGAILWTLPRSGEVDDYDTFAWNGDYFRLMTVNDTVMVAQRVHGKKGTIIWSAYVVSDSNCILTVGGAPGNEAVFIFGLVENKIYRVDGVRGSLQWVLSTSSNPTTGLVDAKGCLYFGDSVSVFRKVC
eukprot:PhF_6_TR5597/c0_g1_i2/m.8048